MKIAAEYDDFGPRNNNIHLLEEIREHYPNFKVTMFTVPWDIRFGSQTPITNEEFKPWCEAVKKLDWIEIAVHGLTHVPLEFSELSYDAACKRIVVAEKMFQNRGINYVKIFKAPHWTISPEAKRAAEDLGFKVVEDGYYNWNLKDDMPETNDVIIAHGHVQNVMENGLEETMPKLMRLPTDTEFLKLSEVILK